jgi:hypothetical protein
VSDASIALDELLDLKMLPAWVNEPASAKSSASGERADDRRQPPGDHRLRHRPGQARRRPTFKADKNKLGRDSESFRGRGRRPPARASLQLGEARPQHRHKSQYELATQISVRFLPHPPAWESVVTQIKENAVAYSVFALARLFLVKPARYDVRLTASAESPLFQLGESEAVSLDRQSLERNAFRLAQLRFYKVEITQSEPIKGNFTNVARCKLSGTLLGPTNHHDYQKRLRSLFEQRFSRRMSFVDYQRQIEIVSDPALVEQWKEEARKITTYSMINPEAPKTFASATEAQRHFRENYLPGLIHPTRDLTIDGPNSRRLFDRTLHRLIEDEWSRTIRSPSQMIQELAGQFRQAGLHIFRHRRGMLFVSPIRPRPLLQDGAAVSPSVNAIIETLQAAPRISRKELAEQLIGNAAGEDQERAKLALASDLHWLIHEGHVVEFNDGSLDLPRVKGKPVETAVQGEKDDPAATAKAEKELAGSTESRSTELAEIGGS